MPAILELSCWAVLIHALGPLETFKKLILDFPIFKNIIFEGFRF